MNNRKYSLLALATVLLFVSGAFPAWSAETSTASDGWEEPGGWFIYGVIFVVLIGSLIAISAIRSSLSNSTWSIGDALSEEVEITVMVKDATGAILPSSEKNKEGNPITAKEMRASSSRMVAMMGMISILFLYMGFGVVVLFEFAKSGKTPDSLNNVIDFLLAGLTLFAPYVINRFSNIFETFKPKSS